MAFGRFSAVQVIAKNTPNGQAVLPKTHKISCSKSILMIQTANYGFLEVYFSFLAHFKVSEQAMLVKLSPLCNFLLRV